MRVITWLAIILAGPIPIRAKSSATWSGWPAEPELLNDYKNGRRVTILVVTAIPRLFVARVQPLMRILGPSGSQIIFFGSNTSDAR